MRFTVNYFWLQKLGNEQADYEDAFAPKVNGSLDQRSFSMAVADGATESCFAADWAKMLTRAFVKEPFTDIEALQARTEILSKRWHSFVNRRPLPWFAEEKVRLGAFATLLGFQLISANNGRNPLGSWSAIAIGDSCLFQVRDDDLICSFPLDSAAAFGSSPTLLSTNLARNLQVWDKVKLCSGQCIKGDLFIFATDALASWFLSQHEIKEKPWNILLGIAEDSSSFESFKAWVDNERRSHNLKNDDTTLLLIRL